LRLSPRRRESKVMGRGQKEGRGLNLSKTKVNRVYIAEQKGNEGEGRSEGKLRKGLGATRRRTGRKKEEKPCTTC